MKVRLNDTVLEIETTLYINLFHMFYKQRIYKYKNKNKLNLKNKNYKSDK